MQLLGEAIQIALNRTQRPIELRDLAGARVATLRSWREIITYLERGYEVYGTKRRARYFRPPEPRAKVVCIEAVNPWVAEFIACWRNQEAAVLWPWTNSEGGPIDGPRRKAA